MRLLMRPEQITVGTRLHITPSPSSNGGHLFTVQEIIPSEDIDPDASEKEQAKNADVILSDPYCVTLNLKRYLEGKSFIKQVLIIDT